MTIGIGCGLFYILSSLYTLTATLRPISTIILFLGIAALVAGLILYGMAGDRRSSSGK
jgi:predicted membrane channel-forming protein YqfA (hemolysin III family)